MPAPRHFQSHSLTLERFELSIRILAHDPHSLRPGSAPLKSPSIRLEIGMNQHCRILGDPRVGSIVRGKSRPVGRRIGSGKVRAFNVRESNGVAYQTPTQAKTQKAARSAANQKLRRQDGSYAGVNSSGLSNSGKSYKFNSATDRAAKTGDRAYVNAKTGKATKNIRGE